MKSPCKDCPIHAQHLKGKGNKDDCVENCEKLKVFWSGRQWGMTNPNYDTIDTVLKPNCNIDLTL